MAVYKFLIKFSFLVFNFESLQKMSICDQDKRRQISYEGPVICARNFPDVQNDEVFEKFWCLSFPEIEAFMRCKIISEQNGLKIDDVTLNVKAIIQNS